MDSQSAIDEILRDEKVFPKFRNGPLTPYRKSASFCWKRMKLILEAPEFIKTQHKVWNFMEAHPEFQRDFVPKTLDEKRRIATRQAMVMVNESMFSRQELLLHPKLAQAFGLSIMSYDTSFAVKYSITTSMFAGVILTLGKGRVHELLPSIFKGDIFGAFALTEIAHGSNANKMRTRATYDANTEEFIMHTPDFEAAKCWIGNLGKTATHAVVFAQLYGSDGRHHGLNCFLVPIRCMKTLRAYPGIIVGDIGEKIGWNGMDNGFLMFNNYRIPRDYLLSKNLEVKPNGSIITAIKDNKKRVAASFGILSAGRVGIGGIATMYLIKAITIAIRYSAVRKQFGPDDSAEEYSIIEYQSQQYRLIPLLASAYAMKIFTSRLSEINYNMLHKIILGEEDVSKLVTEIHALSSASKAICSWKATEGIQECREACGGHGYLKAAGFGVLRNDNDPLNTGEGESNILIQQATNWLLSLYRKGSNAFKEASVIGSCGFLADLDNLLSSKFNASKINEAMEPLTILSALNWLCAWLLDRTAKKCEELKRNSMTAFEIRNETQVFFARNLAIVYGQRNIFYSTFDHVNLLPNSPEKKVLSMLLSLYGADLITKHLGLFYEGGYFTGPIPGELYSEGILNLLSRLKSEAVALVDSLAPPDFILNSVLGMSDGNVYAHLQTAIMSGSEALERPQWWRDVVYKEYLKAKI